MADTAFLIVAGIWTVQALAAAGAARRLRHGALEFFVYGLLMPPAAWLLLAIAGRRSGAAMTGPVLSGGLWTARSGLAAAALAVTATVVLAPDRTLSILERTAHRGIAFDVCAQTASVRHCMPAHAVALVGEAVAGTLASDRENDVTRPAARPQSLRPAPIVPVSRTAPIVADEPAAIAATTAPPFPSDTANRAAPDGRPAVADPDGPERASIPARPASAAQVRSAQILLTSLGYDPGPADGIPGPRTARAVEAFERDTGRAVTGTVSSQLLAGLDREAAALPVRVVPLPGAARHVAAMSNGTVIRKAAPAALSEEHFAAARAPDSVEGEVVGRQAADSLTLAAPLKLSVR